MEASGWSLKQSVLALKEVKQSGLQVKALLQLATNFSAVKTSPQHVSTT